MSTRSMISVLALSILLVCPAYGMELVWSTGGTDLRFSETRQCTLLVKSTGSLSPLPEEWRLVYVTNNPFDPTSQVVAAPSGIADVCSRRERRATIDRVSHADTAVHCADSELPRATVARYTFTVPGGTQARLAVIPVATDGALLPPLVRAVTLNGGLEEPFPPLLFRVRQVRTSGGLTVVATGAYLDAVETAEVVTESATSTSTSLKIVRRDPWQLVAEGPVPYGIREGRLEVANRVGFIEAIRLKPEVDTLSPGPPHILVRFQPGRAEPPDGRTEALTQDFAFLPAGLRDSVLAAGIVRLERLFPQFKHTDVSSTNMLGEPVVLDDLSDIYVAHLATGADGHRGIAALSGNPNVLYAEPDSVAYAPLLIPNDPLFSLQWPLRNVGQTVCGRSGWPGFDIGAEDAWDSLIPVAPTSIAILDTGIDPTHQEFYDLDFNSRLPVGATCMPTCAAGAEDDDNGNGSCFWRHGTAVAGIAAATANNAVGVAGMAFQATPWPVKVINSSGSSAPTWVASGIDYARNHGIPIINMSLRVSDSQTLRTACLNAFLVGHCLVAAIGNDDDSLPKYPAAYGKRVCTVGAMFMDGSRWRDQNIIGYPLLASSYGSWIDLVAPGGRLVVAPSFGSNQYYDLTLYSQPCDAHPNDVCYMGFGGTSGAAAVVSGVAALLKSEIPKLTGEDLTEIMKRTARDDVTYLGFDVFFGSGYVRADAALNYVSFRRGRAVAHGRVGFQGDAGTLAVRDSVFFSSRTFNNVPGLASGNYSCWRYRLRGRAAFNSGFTGTPEIPWVRASGTQGWPDASPFDYSVEVPWGRRFGPLSAAADSFETFVYRIPGSGGSGWWPTTPDAAVIAFTVVGASSLVGVDAPARQLRLAIRSLPNPGTRRITFELELPAQGRVRATILDVLGRSVARLADGTFQAGAHEFHWDAKGSDGRACAPGVYFCSVDYAGRPATQRFVLLGARP